MKKYLLGLWILCLVACSTSPMPSHLPTQSKAERLFKVEQQLADGSLKQASLLSLSAQPNAWRWVQTDPLGAPLARVILDQSGWHNDGFVMPNYQARQLFSALATALNPTHPLFDFSHISQQNGTTTYFMRSQPVWHIAQTNGRITVMLADTSRWVIEELH